MKRFFLITFLIFFSLVSLYAVNIRSIDITYSQISNLTYKFTITVYIFTPAHVVDTYDISWGDGTTGVVHKDTIINLPNDISQCIYKGVHTFNAPYTYKVSLKYYSRPGSILNIPNSVSIPYYVETIVVINPFLGSNNSPVLLNPPIDNACMNNIYIYNPGVYDADGDSISYKLIPCKDGDGNDIPGYTYPGASSSFSIDSISGDIIWDSPIHKGRYDIAILIEEWRNGVKIGSIMRDMIIYVVSCVNNSLAINSISDTCVEAGTLINFDVTGTSQDSDTITLTAYGSPLMLTNSPAQFNQPVSGAGNVTSTYTWQTLCSHIRKKPYRLFFKIAKVDTSNYVKEHLNNFNNGTIGSGWSASNQMMFSNPCPPSDDGTIYLWMGNYSSAPRYVISPAFDVSSGQCELCFDMRYSEHTGISGTCCEGPDLPEEGVYIQYSINGKDGPWIDIQYWDPSIPTPGGHNPGLINWNNYSEIIPVSAKTKRTRFRWLQKISTGKDFDHWGLDNIRIYNIPVNIVDVKTVDITVISPAPKNLNAIPFGNTINLSWNKSECINAVGYEIYRNNKYCGFVPGPCETGVPEYTSYTQIAKLTDINDTTYIDDNNGNGFIHGMNYCYMVVAYFPDGAESYASLEACARMKDDVPIITNVSIKTTDENKGSCYVAWSKPTEIDTIVASGPYKYLIYRSKGTAGSNLMLIDSTANLNDTTYDDTSLDTKNFAYSYKIDLYNDAAGKRFFIGSTQMASSMFLSIAPTDNELKLTLNENVPWNNNQYIIYRKHPDSLSFDSIAYSDSPSYNDIGLINHKNYCYYIKSIGNYSAPGVLNPIINYSQINCAVPIDNIPPCPPELFVSVDCDKVENHLLWSNNFNDTCSADIAKYYIYYSSIKPGSLILIDSTNSILDTTYIHTGIPSIAACYAVTAVDSSMNESKFSNIVCVSIDSCSLYKLPNVFTPNGDQKNDYFRPFSYTSVEKINLKIFNRWGRIVFKTSDPDINWDGKDQKSKKECSPGVYFYVCDVYELRLNGLNKRTLKGSIQLLR